MSQKLNLMKEEMDFFHLFHEANGKPKALNTINVPITENLPQPSKLKCVQEVQSREQLSVLESMQSMDSNRRREGTKKAAPSSERLTMTKESLLRASSDAQVAQNSAIQAKNEDEEEIRYENGLRNGFVYFNRFAVNKWIMIYLIRVGLSNTFIHNHMTALLESAKSQGIPLGMPFKSYVFSLTDDGDKFAPETKERIVQVLTTSRKKVQLAMMYAPNNMDLEELTTAVKPGNNFRIFTGFFTANCGLTEILNSLGLFVKTHKKLPVMGIATRVHDGHVMIARTLNNSETGARFDEPSLNDFQLTIIRDGKLKKHLVSIVRDSIKHRSLKKLVIYRSHESPNCHSMSYQKEVSDIQKLMERSGTRFTYFVAKEIVSGSNHPIFENVVDGIGFPDEEMTRLTTEVSFHSQIKRIPAPLAVAQKSIARMVVHYDGFKQSENYEQGAQVKEGLDTKAYETVKKFLKSSLSDTKAQSKIKSKKKKTKASGELSSDQLDNINQGLNQKTNKVVYNDVETIFDDSGANSYQRELNSDEEQESRTAYVLKYADDVPKVKEKEDNGSKEGKEKCKPKTAKKSTLMPSSEANDRSINAVNEDPEIAIYERGLQFGFVYFNGFAINNWIIIYLVREGLSDNFIHNHLTTIMDKAKLDRIPLGRPSNHYVCSLKSNGKNVSREMKEDIVQVLTTSSRRKLQMAVIYATNDIDLKELRFEITPRFNFRIITGYFIPNKYEPIGILRSLRSFVKEHKKLPVMGIASRIHDGQFMIAHSNNQPDTGARFDKSKSCHYELAIAPENQWIEKLVCIVWNYVKNKDLDELVIYRSHESSICGSVSHQVEASEIQKLMERSGTQMTYVVVKEIASGSNQPIFEKLVDGIGFTDEEMTQLAAEVSFHSQIKRIPTPLAMAQMSIARMVVHYDGFKESENFKQVAQVKEGLDTKAYETVKKFLKSSLSGTKAQSKIKSKKQKTKASGELSSDQLDNINQGLNQKTNKVVNEIENIFVDSCANDYQPRLNSDKQGETRTVYVQKCADDASKVKMKEDNVLKAVKEKDKNMTGLSEKRTAKESTSVVSSHANNSTINVKNEDLEAVYKSGLQNGFVYFNGFAVNNWIMIYLVRVDLSNNFIHNHLNALLKYAKSQGIPLGMPSKYYVFSLNSDGQKVAQETKEEIVHVLTTSSHKKVQMAMIIASNNIHLKELTAEITPMYNFRVIPGYFTAGYGLTKILKSLRLLVQEHKKIRVMGIATLIHDGQLMIARTVNNPKTGAQFDEPSVDGVKLRIVPDCQLNEQLVSIVWDYIKNRFLEKLVIYRSSNGRPVSEVSDIQKLMQQSGTRITYIVAKDIGPNRAIFEKVVDGIGFTDEEMTQLTAEISFHTQKTRIPAPLAVAKMSIARMVVHYDGFKHLGNYEQGAQVKEGLDTKAFKKVKKYLRSSLSDTTATTKIKSQKTKGQAKVSSKQIAFQSDAFMKMRQKGKKVK